ncbi:Serine-threonine/tyrosine-protein kinase, catalytic domain [Dillenia turbinata]|uniref:Serine-threonine/tyrosine-protein kinase, catalytic domain n=1 Tax=Dillenia turbinata TaxID=194707 RepID=A0AAN8ZG81_9MAGN
MENPTTPVRFKLGKQSSLAPDREVDLELNSDGDGGVDLEAIDEKVRLMYLANEGDLEGIKEVLESGIDVNFKDIDGRTALHVAACQGFSDVVDLLLSKGAHIDPKDRWGSTPLADAIHYKNHNVIKLLEKHGAKPLMAPMQVKSKREVDPEELDFTNSVDITKGTFCMASWRGIQVAVKRLEEGVLVDEEKVKAFREELALLQKIRHPNVVQFLGAVTQSSPMMIVTEYLRKGDLRAYLKRRGALRPSLAVRFAMDIARGMNYLHENKPEAIIHRDLEPSNILQDDSGHLKVADFGVSKLLNVARQYVAPEMIEGSQPFSEKDENNVPTAYASKERPPFRAPAKRYAHGLKELIEECWNENPLKRPTFKQIIAKLDSIYSKFNHKRRWKVRTLKCFQNFEAMWKKDNSSMGSRSSSTRSTISTLTNQVQAENFTNLQNNGGQETKRVKEWH